MSFEMSQSSLWEGIDMDLTGYSQITILCSVASGTTYTANLLVNGVLVPIPLQYSAGTSTGQQTTLQSVGLYYIPIGGILRLTGGTGGIFYVKGNSLPTGLTPSGATPSGTALIGDVGVEYRNNSTGGSVPSSVFSPVTPVATSVKASQGRITGIVLQNSAAAVRSVKFFNVAVGGVTLGTTSALFEIDISSGGSILVVQEGGIAFGTAITYAVTAAKGLLDNTGGLALGDVSGVILYA